jgi:hypothetical protein
MGTMQSLGTSEIVENHSVSSEEEYKDIDLADVLILLANFNSSRVPIPVHFVAEILNYAGILPQLAASRSNRFTSPNNCNMSYLRLNLPRSAYIQPTCIYIYVNSKDQGWSSYPEERGKRSSHTWGELQLLNNPAQRFEVFRNIHAGKDFEYHAVAIPLINDQAPDKYKELVEGIHAHRTSRGEY